MEIGRQSDQFLQSRPPVAGFHHTDSVFLQSHGGAQLFLGETGFFPQLIDTVSKYNLYFHNQPLDNPLIVVYYKDIPQIVGKRLEDEHNMFSAIRTIYHGDCQGKTVFDPPYTPEEADLLRRLREAVPEGPALRRLEWAIGVFTTDHEERAFRQGVRIGLGLARELTDPPGKQYFIIDFLSALALFRAALILSV